MMIQRLRLALFIPLVLLHVSNALAADPWWDNHYEYRRPVEINWDSEHAAGDELAEVQFYTAGHILPTGDDIRVATDTGVQVPSRVLMTGPGDSARAAFNLQKSAHKYYVYFGNAKPTPPPKSIGDVKFNYGLLLETRVWLGGSVNNAEECKSSYAGSETVIGRTMIDRPFFAQSPFGDLPQTISRYSGQVSIPVDGEYTFAAAADSRGALFIDDKPIIFAPFCPADIRFNKKLFLKRGRHAFDFYQLHNGGEPRISVGWRRPDMDHVDAMGRDAFGVVSRGKAGAMEGFQKRITADFDLEYEGECFCGGNYSHRYKFTALMPADQKASVKWDFGDDLSGTDAQADHVFMTGGVYPVKITMKMGNFTDTQSTKILVSRDYEQIDKPPTDPPVVQSNIVAAYDVNKMPLKWLPWATLLHLHAERQDAMLVTAARMATEKFHPDDNQAFSLLQEVTQKCVTGPLAAKAMALWDLVPSDSDLQPKAGRYQAQLLMWWVADFDKAVKVLEPMAAAQKDNAGLQRTYAEALILNQKIEQGKRILLALPVKDDPRRQVAISGAMARSVEFFIGEGDWETGEDTWEKWEGKYPSVFLEGYSVLLRTRLMEIKKATVAAAKVAEAFATAVPNSSYSPTLLDRASKLLAKSDPQKSKELRETLKKRYPEDPLSQD